MSGTARVRMSISTVALSVVLGAAVAHADEGRLVVEDVRDITLDGRACRVIAAEADRGEEGDIWIVSETQELEFAFGTYDPSRKRFFALGEFAAVAPGQIGRGYTKHNVALRPQAPTWRAEGARWRADLAICARAEKLEARWHVTRLGSGDPASGQ